MFKIPNSKRLSSGPIVKNPIGGVSTPLITGNVLTKPVSTVLFRPVVRPLGLYN